MINNNYWTVDEVCNWLRSEGLSAHEENFRKSDSDRYCLSNLAEKDIKELGVPSIGEN